MQKCVVFGSSLNELAEPSNYLALDKALGVKDQSVQMV